MHDLIKAAESLRVIPHLKVGYSILVDVRTMETGNLTAEGIRRLAAITGIFSKESRRAVVVSGDSGYGLSRMFNLRLGDDGRTFEIFRDEAQARAYVGLEPELAQPG